MCVEHRVVLERLVQNCSDRQRVLDALVAGLLVEVLVAQRVHLVQEQLGPSQDHIQVVPEQVQDDVRRQPLAVHVHVVLGVDVALGERVDEGRDLVAGRVNVRLQHVHRVLLLRYAVGAVQRSATQNRRLQHERGDAERVRVARGRRRPQRLGAQVFVGEEGVLVTRKLDPERRDVRQVVAEAPAVDHCVKVEHGPCDSPQRLARQQR